MNKFQNQKKNKKNMKLFYYK